MNFETLVMTVVKWAWGTLLTAGVAAVLTVLLRHGNRWSRGVRKFLRTGRWTMGTTARGRGNPIASSSPRQGKVNSVTRNSVPKLSVEQILGLLGQSNSQRTPPLTPPHLSTNGEGETPLDLRF